MAPPELPVELWTIVYSGLDVEAAGELPEDFYTQSLNYRRPPIPAQKLAFRAILDLSHTCSLLYHIGQPFLYRRYQVRPWSLWDNDKRHVAFIRSLLDTDAGNHTKEVSLSLIRGARTSQRHPEAEIVKAHGDLKHKTTRRLGIRASHLSDSDATGEQPSRTDVEVLNQVMLVLMPNIETLRIEASIQGHLFGVLHGLRIRAQIEPFRHLTTFSIHQVHMSLQLDSYAELFAWAVNLRSLELTVCPWNYRPVGTKPRIKAWDMPSSITTLMIRSQRAIPDTALSDLTRRITQLEVCSIYFYAAQWPYFHPLQLRDTIAALGHTQPTLQELEIKADPPKVWNRQARLYETGLTHQSVDHQHVAGFKSLRRAVVNGSRII